MKKQLFAAALILSLSAVEAWSQSGAANMIKGRAREAAGRPAPPKNGGPAVRGGAVPRQGVTQPPASRVKTPTRLVESDLSLIRLKPVVTEELRDRLAEHIRVGAGADAKPDMEAVKQLAAEVAGATQKHKLGFVERKKLAAALMQAVSRDAGTSAALEDLATVLGGAGVSADEWKQLAASFQRLIAPATITTAQ